MNLFDDFHKLTSRRAFLARHSTGLGIIALSSWLNGTLFGAEKTMVAKSSSGVLKQLDHPAKAKRIICLFRSGAPTKKTGGRGGI